MSRALTFKNSGLRPIDGLQRRDEAGTGQSRERNLLRCIEFDWPQSRRIEQNAHHTIGACHVAYWALGAVNQHL